MALEIAGFLLVVFGVGLYFILPALPTLLPPTQSSDAVRVYLQVLFSYPEGKLVSWYPAGGAFVAAMFARWLDWAPLRILHPTAASFIALSAGAVCGITCAILPRQRFSKIVALIAPALLFVPWSYFAGTLNWEQYFFAQVFAQYFILAALWYIASYTEQPRWVFAVLIGAALLGVVAAYPIFVALPLALRKLIMRIKTNSLEPGVPKDPEGSTLFDIYRAFATPPEVEAMQRRYAEGAGWGEIKEQLFEYLDAHLRAPRAEYERLIAAPDHVERVLRRGAERARALATPFLAEIRRGVGIRPLA